LGVQTLVEQADAVRRGDVSPVELVDDALVAIERVQPDLNAFTRIFTDDSRALARKLEGAEPAGPLHGVPVAVKDLYDMAGIPTTGCCAAYMDRVASSDSAVVSKLRAAGAIIVAKTNQHELACGATTLTSSFGPAFNPWGEGRIAGGSSGGSGIAVAAGAVAMAMGSDTGGSIRIPSSFCGVTGLKPTHGAVSLRGAMPMCPSLDTAGPLARSARDCALVHELLSGTDPDYLWSRSGAPVAPVESLDGVRIGVPRTYLALIHTETRTALEEAARVFESLGAEIVEVEGPDIAEAFTTFGSRLAEVAACYRDLWDDDRISQPLQRFIGFGRSVSGVDFFGGREIGLKVRADFERALVETGALLAPCTAYPAPRAGDQDVAVEGGTLDVHHGGATRLTLPVNVAGIPSLAFPVGSSGEGLPIGAQLIGADWSELRLCSIVAAYQDATDWHLRTPDRSG
jgi:aspartyl-tRNA(Asn)/glutamyl-tRNA(Gln) amidotransferase subunit A